MIRQKAIDPSSIIAPDKAPIHIAWERFTVGASVFVPCINTTKAIKQIKEITDPSDMQIRYSIRSEGGKWGVRIWRIL